MEELLELDEILSNKYITFKLDTDTYAISIAKVIEIVGLHKITSLPDMPNYIKGVINLRGRIIPIMDTHVRFKKPAFDYDETSSIVIVQIKEVLIGMIVDKVQEVLEIRKDQISNPPEVGGNNANRFISGVGLINEQIYLIIDCDRLLTESEFASLNKE